MAHGEMITPIGPLKLLVGPRGLMRIDLPNAPAPSPEQLRRALEVRGMGDLPLVAAGDTDPRVLVVKQQLREYFEKKRKKFDVPLDLCGAPFDRRVWDVVGAIAFGKVATYAAVAQAIGAPRAFRATGAANGRNPIPILIPCHRVVGSGGRLTGYGGGTALKAWLLRHEGVALDGDVVTDRAPVTSRSERPPSRSARGSARTSTSRRADPAKPRGGTER